MKIINVKITDVTIGFMDDTDRLFAKLTFEGQEDQKGCCQRWLILTNPVDAQCLMKLMRYTGINEVKDLIGKSVRKIENDDGFFYGFGDPIEDKFVLFCGEELKEVTEVQFIELLKNK